MELAGIEGVDIVQINGRFTDCYDPRHKVVKLSTATYGSSSVAALGVCAHEVGHAIQDAKGSFLFRLRLALVPVINFVSKLFVPLVLFGSILSFVLYIESVGYYITIAAVILYGASMIFYMLTLPLEYDASKKAVQLLRDTGTLTGGELDSAKKVLKAAIQTYVAELVVSILYFLRFLSYAAIFNKE